jgi:hypothetical protein
LSVTDIAVSSAAAKENSMLITSLSAVFGLMADVASEAYND